MQIGFMGFGLMEQPMAAKLASQDFTVQASISDVRMNNRLIFESARSAVIASPLLDICFSLYSEAEKLGHGQLDMISVSAAIKNLHVPSKE